MDGYFRMSVRRRAHMHHINVQVRCQHYFMVIKHLAEKLKPLFHGFRFLRIDVTQGHNPAPLRKGKQSLYMGRRNISGSHNRYIQHD